MNAINKPEVPMLSNNAGSTWKIKLGPAIKLPTSL